MLCFTSRKRSNVGRGLKYSFIPRLRFGRLSAPPEKAPFGRERIREPQRRHPMRLGRRQDVAARPHVVLVQPSSGQPQGISANAGQAPDIVGPSQMRVVTERSQDGRDQAAVSACRLDSVRSRTFQKDRVYVALGRLSEPVGQLLFDGQAVVQVRHPTLMDAQSVF